MAIQLPGIIKVSPEQLMKIEHDTRVLTKRNHLLQVLGRKGSCGLCDCHVTNDMVFPLGNVESSIVFVCDSITKQDTDNKIPFSNETSILFQILLEKMSIKRDEVYLTSLYKCLDAEEGSKFLCANNILLVQEIRTIKPKIVVGLGEGVAKCFFPLLEYNENPADIEKLRGKVHPLQGAGVQFGYIQTYSTETLLKDFDNLSGGFCNDIMTAVKLSKG